VIRKHLLTPLVAACAMAVLTASMADAQRVRRFYQGGRAPLVRVQVGPYGGVSVRAPFVAVDPGGVRVGVGRRHAPVPQYGAPHPAYRPAQPVPVARIDNHPFPPQPFPTAEQIVAMDDGMLLATLREMNDRLDARLTGFNTGKSWRRYLRIPEDALGVVSSSPAIRLDVLQQKLTHFHNVAANPEFATIARLPSFIATHLALDQVVNRYGNSHGGPQLIQPPNGSAKPAERAAENPKEVLPTPAVKPQATLGERSILRRTARN